MPETLAQLIRKKYPGTYDDLSDQDLESKVRAKYPGSYDDLPGTPAGGGLLSNVKAGLVGTEEGRGGVKGAFVAPDFRLSDIVKGPKELVTHPIESSKLLFGAAQEGSQQQFEKMFEAADRGMAGKGGFGGIAEVAARGVAGTIPFIGPGAAEAGDLIKEGVEEGNQEKISAGIGLAAGLILPMMKRGGAPKPEPELNIGTRRGVTGIRTPEPMGPEAGGVRLDALLAALKAAREAYKNTRALQQKGQQRPAPVEEGAGPAPGREALGPAVAAASPQTAKVSLPPAEAAVAGVAKPAPAPPSTGGVDMSRRNFLRQAPAVAAGVASGSPAEATKAVVGEGAGASVLLGLVPKVPVVVAALAKFRPKADAAAIRDLQRGKKTYEPIGLGGYHGVPKLTQVLNQADYPEIVEFYKDLEAGGVSEAEARTIVSSRESLVNLGLVGSEAEQALRPWSWYGSKAARLRDTLRGVEELDKVRTIIPKLREAGASNATVRLAQKVADMTEREAATGVATRGLISANIALDTAIRKEIPDWYRRGLSDSTYAGFLKELRNLGSFNVLGQTRTEYRENMAKRVAELREAGIPIPQTRAAMAAFEGRELPPTYTAPGYLEKAYNRAVRKATSQAKKLAEAALPQDLTGLLKVAKEANKAGTALEKEFTWEQLKYTRFASVREITRAIGGAQGSKARLIKVLAKERARLDEAWPSMPPKAQKALANLRKALHEAVPDPKKLPRIPTEEEFLAANPQFAEGGPVEKALGAGRKSKAARTKAGAPEQGRGPSLPEPKRGVGPYEDYSDAQLIQAVAEGKKPAASFEGRLPDVEELGRQAEAAGLSVGRARALGGKDWYELVAGRDKAAVARAEAASRAIEEAAEGATADQHAELGRALGYTEDDIKAYTDQSRGPVGSRVRLPSDAETGAVRSDLLLAPFRAAARAAGRLPAVPLTRSERTGSRASAMAERAVESSFPGAPVFERFRQRQQKALIEGAAAETVRRIAPKGEGPEPSGRSIQAEIQQAQADLRAQGSAKYVEIDALAKGVQVPTAQVKAFANQVKAELVAVSGKKGLLPKAEFTRTMDILNKIRQAPASVPFATMHAFRSNLLAKIRDLGVEIPDRAAGVVKKFSRLADESMEQVARQHGFHGKVREASAFWRDIADTFNESLVNRMSETAPEKVHQLLRGASLDDIRRVRRVLKPERFQEAKANLLADIFADAVKGEGSEALGRGRSVSMSGARLRSILENRSQLGPARLRELFGPGELANINKVLQYAEKISPAGRSGSIGTFINVINAALLYSTGKGVTDLFTKGPEAALAEAGTAAGIYAGTRALARLMTRPEGQGALTRFMKSLAEAGAKVGEEAPAVKSKAVYFYANQVAAALGREADRERREAAR